MTKKHKIPKPNTNKDRKIKTNTIKITKENKTARTNCESFSSLYKL